MTAEMSFPYTGRYYSLNQYLRQTFGRKVYKLALDGGMTCPNRDGTLDTRGCIFCSGGGSGEFAQKGSGTGSAAEQLRQAKERVSRKISDGAYIAYFQSFTNTYAPVEYLETLFTSAICQPDIVALSIATRPDCLPPEVLDLLERLNRIKPVWIELGLQTIHPATAAYIRRGYPLDCYRHAVGALKGRVSHIITHVILGLPGETPDDMVQTVRCAAETGTNGIKLQLLHVLKGTDLAADYEKGLFPVLTLEEYCAILGRCLQALPPHIVIHRLTGDGPKKLLIAPEWSGDKKRVLNTITGYLEKHDIRQGSACRTSITVI